MPRRLPRKEKNSFYFYINETVSTRFGTFFGTSISSFSAPDFWLNHSIYSCQFGIVLSNGGEV
jgi:hypothetical protein